MSVNVGHDGCFGGFDRELAKDGLVVSDGVILFVARGGWSVVQRVAGVSWVICERGELGSAHVEMVV